MLEWKEQIRDKLKQAGYTNTSITYTELLQLYAPYKESMSEMEFADVLGIAYSNFMRMKHKGTRAKILKEEIQAERKQEIIQSLQKKQYTNTYITYTEFLELYEPYMLEMKESEFANIIGLSHSNWKNIKFSNKRAKILKEEKQITQERKQEIKQELIEKGYTKKKITYTEFLDIYVPYKDEMQEREFATVLGISYAHFSNMKNKGSRAVILKEKKIITQEKKKEIIQYVIEWGYINQMITYLEFRELYQPYKTEMKEREFAEIIGISYGNF